MNTASDYPLIDRYLDGLTTQDEAAAVVEAVESDPDALAWLRQAAEMEAGIQFHLAGSSQHRPRLCASFLSGTGTAPESGAPPPPLSQHWSCALPFSSGRRTAQGWEAIS